MSSWARPGVKCVCVYDGPAKIAAPVGYHWTGRVNIVSGEIYEIESVGVSPLTGSQTVTLKGVSRRGPRDYGYAPSRFRPLVTRTQQQDVAMFSHLLTGAPVRRKEKA